ncbi:hypothetical protein PSE_4200 [Pseudovibrio sp. FO-BEG1]|nr:hypothetical protein PSE_4200 [Pseudovibrio sp. FO-BEG1]EEA96697.1 hypothetical protein PJE062_1535 [Pseudovibrio sp. JE062]
MKRGIASHGIFWLGKREASQAFLDVRFKQICPLSKALKLRSDDK